MKFITVLIFALTFLVNTLSFENVRTPIKDNSLGPSEERGTTPQNRDEVVFEEEARIQTYVYDEVTESILSDNNEIEVDFEAEATTPGYEPEAETTATVPPTTTTENRFQRPNVILIIADDLVSDKFI